MTNQEKLARLTQHGLTHEQAIQAMRMDEDGTLDSSAIAARYNEVIERYQKGGEVEPVGNDKLKAKESGLKA